MGSPPSALGFLAPARAGLAGRLVRNARLAIGSQHWPDPKRAAGAIALAALDGAWAAALRPALSGLLALVGSVAFLAVFGGLLARRYVVVVVGLSLLGAEYLVSQAGRPVSVVVAAAFGTVLLATGELAWWSAELSVRSLWGLQEVRRRWGVLVVLVGGGFALSVVVGVAGVARLRPPAAVAVAGALAGLVAALSVASWVREVVGRPPSGAKGRTSDEGENVGATKA